MSDHKKSIKQGAKWTFIGFMAQKGVVFLVGIVLARLLEPEDFGLLGMVMVFVSLFDVIVDSGFGYVIVRYDDIDKKILDSVLTINILLAIFCFVLINLSNELIQQFFKEPKLEPLIFPMSFMLLINAFRIVPYNINIRNLLFKQRTIINGICAIASGILGITLAFNGFGVMSLIYQLIFATLLSTIMHNYVSEYKLNFYIDKVSSLLIWKRSFRIFTESITRTVFSNMNKIIIGRFFSAQSLGFYTRGHSFPSLTQKAIVQVVQNSIFPVFTKIKLEEEIKSITRTTIKVLCAIYMPIILALAATSDNLILFLLTDKWEESIFFAQVLAIASCLFAPQMVLRNVLKSRNDKAFLISENANKFTRLTFLIALIPFGIKVVILGQAINGLVALLISGYYTKKEIAYTFYEQISDYGTLFLMAIIIVVPVYLIGYFLNLNYAIELAIQGLVFVTLYLVFLKVKKINPIKMLKK